MKHTEQEKFWAGQFGKEYTDRNTRDPQVWESFYQENWGTTKKEINQKLIGELPKDVKILEVGSNTGMQLRCLQEMGFTNLYGVELQHYAVEKSKEYTKNINIIQGSGFDLPFKDNFFDVVCTNGVLIHIHPNDHKTIMSEMLRCSKTYIMGFEYYAPQLTEVNYRGNDGFLWKGDFAQLFMDNFNNLEEVRRDFYKYRQNDNVDYAYLLKKKQ